MRPALVLVLSVAVGCGAKTDRRAALGEDICRRLGDRIEARRGAYAADLPALRAWSGAGLATRFGRRFDAIVNDLRETYRMARALGDTCIEYPSPPACRTPLDVLDNPDAVLEGMQRLADGFRRVGPCAPDAGARRDETCHRVELWLGMPTDEELMNNVRAGLSTPFDANGLPTQYADLAAQTMSEWRAVIDFGLALAPACAPQGIAAGCEGLREGFAGATPDDLVGRVRALQNAYAGSPCPSSL